MRKLLSILSFVLILTGAITVKAENPSCGIYNDMRYACSADQICCPDDKGVWRCCPHNHSCCFPDKCCAPTEICCKGKCCRDKCESDGKCPHGAEGSSVRPAVQAITSNPK